MEKSYLNEAFQALDMLNEDTFDISTEGTEDLKNFLDDEDNTNLITMDIVDTEADDKEEIKDSYIGQIVCDCEVCHSKVYKDKDDIVIDEKTGLANIDEECPFCFSTEGYSIVGEIKPYNNEVDITPDESLKEDKQPKSEKFFSIEDAKQFCKEIEEKRPNSSPIIVSNNNEGTFTVLYESLKESFDNEKIKKAEQILIDNGVDPDEADIVLQAIGYALLDTELYECLEESAASDISEYQKWVDYDMKKYNKISDLTMEKIKSAGFSVVKDQYGDYEVIADRTDECLEEDFQKVEVETDTEKMEMSSDENGKTTITTEPKFNDYSDEEIEETEVDIDTEVSDEDVEEISNETVENVDSDVEVVAQLDDETEAELKANTPEDEGAIQDDEMVDVDFEEFDEEDFDELGESYLKKVYENVDSFKTSSVTTVKDSLIIEGVITFDSGNKKSTSFIFESKDITKTGKLRFIGENKQLSRGRKTFTLTGKVVENKLVCESLNYNYRGKDANGSSTRIYGTVKTSK